MTTRVVLEVDSRGRKTDNVDGSLWFVVPFYNYEGVHANVIEDFRGRIQALAGCKVYTAREVVEGGVGEGGPDKPDAPAVDEGP